MKQVLVTGCAGYIGSVLTKKLLAEGYRVIGYDSLIFGGESLLDILTNDNFIFVKGDIRDTELLSDVVKEVDYIVHLAAIVGDPACAAKPVLAREVNLDASKDLLRLVKENPKIEKFIFASTCSNYGKMKDTEFVDETSPLNPVSLYAELKVEFEKYMLSQDIRSCVTSLRFSTVYGLSPRMRFDLTVNEFVKELTLGRELLIFGEQFWRPYCHVNDLSRACIFAIKSEFHRINKEVFNVGDTSENYQKKTIAEEILKVIPDAKIKYVKKDEDPRDYKVNFDKIKRVLNYSITRRLPDGIKEIYKAVKEKIILNPEDKRYYNV
jgi:nucleoside-diphosphate-sugar epimerase